MPRKYNKVIRYYSSWFDDLTDPLKELTPTECWQIFVAIRDCQLIGSLEPLESLPIEIRRALSMATMGEQVVRLIETSNNMRNRGAEGGKKTAVLRQEAAEAARMREQLRDKEIKAMEERLSNMRAGAVSREKYLELKKRAQEGDTEAINALKQA